MNEITKNKEFVDPTTELEWTPVEQKEETIIYRDENSGTYSRMLRSSMGLGEGVLYEEGKGCCFHEFDEVVYIASGGGINRRLGYRYKPGSVALFPHMISHGPLEAPFGRVSLEFRHYVKKINKESATEKKEFIDPISELEWTTKGVQEKGASETIIYRDQDSGTYCRMLRFPEGFGEGVSYEEGEGCMVNEFDEVVYIVSGGLINRRLGHRYKPGTIGVFFAGTSHGPFEAPLGALLLQFCHYRKKDSRNNPASNPGSTCC